MNRQQLIAKRNSLSLQEVNASSEKICQNLCALPVWKQAQHVASYFPIQNEVAPSECLKHKKDFYFPRCNKDNMSFHRFAHEDSLEPNDLGFLQPPSTAKIIPATTLDVVLVPLVGFDTARNRIGWGKGYYDRCFAFMLENPRQKTPILIGLGYSWQQCEALVANDWDVPLDIIVTEKDVF